MKAKSQSFAQYVLDYYGKSVYEIELDLAMRFYGAGADVRSSWALADEFINWMKKRFEKIIDQPENG